VIEAGSAPGLTDQAYMDTGNGMTTYTATQVASGVYYARIRARGANGALSEASNETVVSVGNAFGPCSDTQAPWNLSAVVRGSTVMLYWQGTGSGVSYAVEAGSWSGATNLASFDIQSTSPSYVAYNVGPGTYFVRVRTTNACGARSGASNEIVVTVR
jgi:hypothetical protein